MDEQSIMEHHSDNLSTNDTKSEIDVGNLRNKSNFKNCLNLEDHEIDKDDDSLESNNNSEPRQYSNENYEKCTSNESDDENSNKSLTQEFFVLDSNEDIEQSEQSICLSESNKEKQYKSAANTVQGVMIYEKSKRYELRASSTNKKENFDKYAVTSSDSDSDSNNDTELRQTLNESDDDDYYINSNDSDYINDILSDAEYENLSIREKHNMLRQYQLRSSQHSYKKDKFNKYTVTSDDSQDTDDDDSANKQFRHESDNDDDTNDYIKRKERKKSAAREKRKLLNRYKLQRSHLNKKDNAKCVQNNENNKELSQVSLSDKTDYAIKYSNNTKSVQANDNKNLANENNKKVQNNDSEDDDKLLFDLIQMEKLKTSQRYELQKDNLDKIDKSSINAKLSKSDRPSTYKSNQELHYKNGRSNDSNNSNNKNSINPEKHKKSQNKNDASDSDDYFSQSQASNDSRKSDNSNADMNLDESMDIVKAWYRSNISNHKLASIFYLSRQQLKDNIANSEQIIKEYKQKYPNFDENDLTISKTRICNTLSLDERIEVLRVSNRSSHYNHTQLATIFNCSKEQIKYTLKNRMRFINEYKMQHSEFDKNDSIKNADCKLSWNECMDVIKVYYRSGYSNRKLAVMFNCSSAEIRNIFKNSNHFLNEYKKISNFNTLSLEDGIEVLREYDSNHYSYDKLAMMFNCSMANIESTLANRNDLIEKYKEQHPDFNENELENSNSIFCDHPLSLNKCIDVIKAYNSNLCPYYKLSSIFKCSIEQIKHILMTQNSIIKEYKRLHPELHEMELKREKSIVSSSSSSSTTLGLDDRIDVIRVHNRNQFSCEKIASMFNCSRKEIINIIQNPKTVFKEYKKIHQNFDKHQFRTNSKIYRFTLSLDERMEVLKAHRQHKCPYYKLAFMFNCLMADIKYTLDNRRKFINKYKTLHPNFDEHEFRMKPVQVVKPLTLNERIAVLKVHDRYDHPYYKLAVMFKCSIVEIEKTMDNRALLIEQFAKQHPEHVENEMIDSHDEDNGQGESNSVNKPSVERCIEVISTYDLERDYTNLSFNRTAVIATYERFKKNNISDKDDQARQHENKDDQKNLNISIAKAAIPKIETQPEPTDDFNDVYQESNKILNEMCHFNTDNPKLLDNDQNDTGDDKDDINGIDLTNEKTLRWWNKPHMHIYLQVIKAYDEINSFSVVARQFKCSWLLVYSIIENRIAILKALGRPIFVKLTFLQRIDVIRDYKCKRYTYSKLRQIYNCKLSEILKCISDSDSYMQIYEKLYPPKSKSEHKPSTIRNKVLPLEIQKEVIKSFDQYPNEMLLSRLYNCSLQQIFEILKNRNEILNKNTNSLKYTLENLSVSCHQDVLLALKPLSNYAELVSNTTAINIMSQLEQHLLGYKTNLSKSNYENPRNLEICSYLDALKALKPIEDYTYSSTNYKAKYAMTELRNYLRENV